MAIETRTTPQKARTTDRLSAYADFEAAVLRALDQAAKDVFRDSPMMGRDPGASDADLPILFPVIRAHVDRLAARFGFELTGEG